jgi:hypothetical protein
MIYHEQEIKLDKEDLLNQVTMHEKTLAQISSNKNNTKHPQDHPSKGARKYSTMKKRRREQYM